MVTLNSNLPLVSGQCSSRAEQMRDWAGRFLDQDAKDAMLQAAAAYDTLATLRMSLERDLELRAKSDEMIKHSKLEIARNWHWVG
jgi:hypothetical protein